MATISCVRAIMTCFNTAQARSSAQLAVSADMYNTFYSSWRLQTASRNLWMCSHHLSCATVTQTPFFASPAALSSAHPLLVRSREIA